LSSILDKLRGKRFKRSTVVVPATFSSQVEEAKVSALLDKKELMIINRVRARARHKLTYVRSNGDGKPPQEESSIGDEVIRHGMEESVGWGGLLGEETPLTREQFIALSKLRLGLESLQAEHGADYPLTQTIARLTRQAKDTLLPFTITRSDVDVERVTVPVGVANPFGNLNVNLSESGEKEKEIEDLVRRQAKEKGTEK
jgi:hypothetical protein